MTDTTSREIQLVSRPNGMPTAANFAIATTKLEPLQAGQVLVRNLYMSVDPYMRGRMNDGKSYAQPQPLDAVMIGGTVGEVVDSRHPRFAPGEVGGVCSVMSAPPTRGLA
jgi:NADPH-dependent curcumin reductase CurA